MKISRIILYGIASPIIAFLLYAAITTYREPYSHGGSLNKLQKVHAGMTRPQVVDIMGEPNWCRQTDDGMTVLTYGHSSKLCNLRITLSPEEIVISKQHAHNPVGPPEK